MLNREKGQSLYSPRYCECEYHQKATVKTGRPMRLLRMSQETGLSLSPSEGRRLKAQGPFALLFYLEHIFHEGKWFLWQIKSCFKAPALLWAKAF